MRHSLSFLGNIALLVLATSVASAADLFNCHDFADRGFTTTLATGVKELSKILPDGAIAVAGRPAHCIASTATDQNYGLHAKWHWSDKPRNGVVRIHISSAPKNCAWPLSLQIQTRNTDDLPSMAGAIFAEPRNGQPGAQTPIKARTESIENQKPAGKWNGCDIICWNGTVEVTVNGALQNEITQVMPRSGRVGSQFEDAPFEIRHITLTPLD